MEKAMDLVQFYELKKKYIPDGIHQEFGHFNVFVTGGFSGTENKCLQFRRSQFYKICLFSGHHLFKFGDRAIDFDQPALLFMNPQVPYALESLSGEPEGYYCIFTGAFFRELASILKFHIFQPDGHPVFLLSSNQYQVFREIFKKMLNNVVSDYIYKYDLLRAQVQLIVHEALQIQPYTHLPHSERNAATRITALFVELLEFQFPIESSMQKITFRHPSDFSEKIAVSINHLNKSLKETTGLTTITLINNRIMLEARMLLKNTDWNVSEIGWCLGFEDPAHFINFFKKNAGVSPNTFRGS